MYQLNNNSEHSLRFTVDARFNSTTQVLMTPTGVADDKSSWLLAYYLPQLEPKRKALKHTSETWERSFLQQTAKFFDNSEPYSNVNEP